MLESCRSPSARPTSTCVESPSRRVKTGAQITVENRDSMSAGRLTTTNTRDRLRERAQGLLREGVDVLT